MTRLVIHKRKPPDIGLMRETVWVCTTTERPDDDVIDNDLILVWGAQKRIITGADLLGRLLRGIARVETMRAHPMVRPT